MPLKDLLIDSKNPKEESWNLKIFQIETFQTEIQ